MARPPFDPRAVSSLAEVLAEHIGGLTFVPTAHLPLWLPDLTVPPGWVVGAVDGPTVTRMLLLRRSGSGNHGDGCEVLNLYRFSGTVPEALVIDHADRTLRDSGADAIQTLRVDTPPRYGVIAARSSGRLRVGAHTVYGQYSYYVVNTAAGGALIEQTVIVPGDDPSLSGEVAKLTDDLYRALLSSIDRASTPPGSQNTGQNTAARHPKHVSSSPTQIPSDLLETGHEWRPMSVIRVNYLPEFHYGDDAVLLTLDGGGVDEFKAALSEAKPQESSRLEHDGVTHEFRIESGTADIELDPSHVVWRLDHAKAAEIIEDLAVLSDKGSKGGSTSGHFYVDMSAPTETLVVSRDEYVDVVYPWLSPA
jgi:hypothetical protein